MPAKRADAVHRRRVHRPDDAALLARLRRIEGQVRGVAKMVADDRYCIDVLTQITAARSALDAVALELLRAHLRGCVEEAVASGEGEGAVEELLVVLEKMAR